MKNFTYDFVKTFIKKMLLFFIDCIYIYMRTYNYKYPWKMICGYVILGFWFLGELSHVVTTCVRNEIIIMMNDVLSLS